MRKNKVSGFTLIELLVVITIIGILAVGGVSVYTQQLAKSRDSSRINGLQQLRAGLEQFNVDNATFPATNAFDASLNSYITQMPTDPTFKTTAGCSSQICDIIYNTDTVASIVDYEVSVAFENATNLANKGLKDGGSAVANGGNRYEIFSKPGITTSLTTYPATTALGLIATTGADGTCNASAVDSQVVIRANCN